MNKSICYFFVSISLLHTIKYTYITASTFSLPVAYSLFVVSEGEAGSIYVVLVHEYVVKVGLASPEKSNKFIYVENVQCE